ncbi:MAG: hypothetical protein ACRDPG_10015 [Nocardioidaceae bacterium]
MLHAGSLDEIDQTYGALGTHVVTRAVGATGPIREHYVVSPLDTGDVAAYRTEVAWPVYGTSQAV